LPNTGKLDTVTVLVVFRKQLLII